MYKEKTKQTLSGWHLFWKSVGYTVAAISLVALGYFGAMAVSGMFV